MSRAYRVWDNQEKCYSDKAFSIDQLGICYVQDEDGYWEEIDDSRFIVEFETGLTDKNANMICEGDIVEANYFESHYAALDVGKIKQITGRIHFGSGCFYISSMSSMSDETPLFQSGGSNNIEVIGNIHELNVEE